ncbi:phosphatase PAP2 family protein [Sphingomonas sp. SUN019]|uniref:phosphatase PAP2 family protein n=1 Tax=Sphingomonas sp. SUN019 TaxID=2937788 RepID=UPI0021644B01|nr:phosphatase PAP2 family protein [Sphingomonas sp. SUN019]UVO49707.1 phosphatase PAP2 family protein [Sphingomonas sp. SUN019]
MRRWIGLERAARDGSLADFFERLDARELDHVRRYVGHMERKAVRHVAIVLNRLSNGSLYPIVAAILLLFFGRPILAGVIIATSSVLCAHLIYPGIKTRCARRRPFDCDPSIASLLKPLDRYSFPSGHAMTATAAFVPLAVAMPAIATPAIATVILIGWARIAAGHHYPTDVLAGALLGSVIAGPGLIWLS